MCPADKSTDLTRSFRGVIVAIDPAKSEITKEAGLNAPGKFAIRIK
jgi:RNA polymerase subunit RPABC4/transcription elongation factor Spt4